MGSPGVAPVNPGADVRFLLGVLTVTPPFRVYFCCEALFSVPFESKQGVQPGGAAEDLLPVPVTGIEVDAIIDEGEQGGPCQLIASWFVVVLFESYTTDFGQNDVVRSQPNEGVLWCALLHTTPDLSAPEEESEKMAKTADVARVTHDDACLASVARVAREYGIVGDRVVVLGNEDSAREVWVDAADFVDHERETILAILKSPY